MGLNGLHSVIPFGPAVMLHTIAALALLALWIFCTFWLFTTGTWKQFIPKIEGMDFDWSTIVNDKGEQVKTAGPSTPVQVLGLSAAPSAGDDLVALADERKAREVAELRRERHRDSRLAEQKAAKLDQLFSQMAEGEVSYVNLIVKADVQGSLEPIVNSLEKLSNDAINNVAVELDLDIAQFNKDMNSPEIRQMINKDLLDAQKAGVTGTPTIFINGKKLKNRSPEGFQAMIDKELKGS